MIYALYDLKAPQPDEESAPAARPVHA
jgi:hypothetical protein